MALTPVQKRRREIKLYTWTGAALVFACVAVANIVVSYLPLRLDTSDGRVYSISKGTKGLVGKLDDTLLCRVIFSRDLPAQYKLNQQYLEDLLAEYKRASGGKVRVEYFDPGISPQARQEAIDFGVPPVQIDKRQRDRRELQEAFMGLSLVYGDKREAIQVIQDTQNLEYDISQRIKKLTSTERAVVAFATDGGALPLTAQGLEPLREPLSQLYEVQAISLAQPVPAEVKSLWLIGPDVPLDGTAVANMKAFVERGGALGLALDRRNVEVSRFTTSELDTGLAGLLAEWGLKFEDGLVVDPRSDRIQIRSVQGQFQMINIVDYPYFPWVADVDRSHPATKSIDGVTMPFTSGFTVERPVPGVSVRTLAKTSEFSWLDRQPDAVSPVQMKDRPADAPAGPFSVIVTVERAAGSSGEKPGRVILFGTSKFVNAGYPARPSNYALFANLLDWSMLDEDLLSIRSKGAPRRPIREMPDGVRLLVKYAMILTLPIGAALAGFLVWRAQRRRREMLPLIYREA